MSAGLYGIVHRTRTYVLVQTVRNYRFFYTTAPCTSERTMTADTEWDEHHYAACPECNWYEWAEQDEVDRLADDHEHTAAYVGTLKVEQGRVGL